MPREMTNRDDEKIPLAGSYLNNVNQPQPMMNAGNPSGETTSSATYSQQLGTPPSYSAAMEQPQNQTVPQNKGLTM